VTDSMRMDRVLRAFPDQLLKGWDLAAAAGQEAGGCKRVVIAGMGGSALPADLVQSYLRYQRGSTLPLEVSRDYQLPPGIDRRTLLIACSFSGNTEETLSAYEAGLAQGASTIALASGGALLARAREAGRASVKLEVPWAGFQPRCSLGYVFGALLRVLDNAGLERSEPKILDRAGAFLRAAQADLERAGERLAARLRDRIVLVYASDRFGVSVARTFKIKLNENAKIPAFWSVLPELNHNEMIGLSRGAEGFVVLLLEEKDQDPRMARRFSVLARMLASIPVTVERRTLEGSDYLETALWGVLLGDWTSYHLALQSGIDPSPVDWIEEFKRRLG